MTFGSISAGSIMIFMIFSFLKLVLDVMIRGYVLHLYTDGVGVCLELSSHQSQLCFASTKQHLQDKLMQQFYIGKFIIEHGIPMLSFPHTRTLIHES